MNAPGASDYVMSSSNAMPVSSGAPNLESLSSKTYPRRFEAFSNVLDSDSDEFKDVISQFAKDETGRWSIPDIKQFNHEHAAEKLMDSMKSEFETHKVKYGLDEDGLLKNPHQFGKQAKRFEPLGIIKNFPVYVLVVSTHLFPWDRVDVLRKGPSKMAALIATKTRGLSSYLLFLYSTNAIDLLWLLSDDLDQMIRLGHVMTDFTNLKHWVDARKQVITYSAKVTGLPIKKGMAGLVEAIMTLCCALRLFGIGLKDKLTSKNNTKVWKPPLDAANIDRLAALAGPQKKQQVIACKKAKHELAEEVLEEGSFMNGLDWMRAVMWASMKVYELMKKQGDHAWGKGGLELADAILVHQLLLFLTSISCLYRFASISRLTFGCFVFKFVHNPTLRNKGYFIEMNGWDKHKTKHVNEQLHHINFWFGRSMLMLKKVATKCGLRQSGVDKVVFCNGAFLKEMFNWCRQNPLASDAEILAHGSAASRPEACEATFEAAMSNLFVGATAKYPSSLSNANVNFVRKAFCSASAWLIERGSHYGLSLTKAAWSDSVDVMSAVDCLGKHAGSSGKEMRNSYFLFGMPATWNYNGGLQLVLQEVSKDDEDDADQEEVVELLEYPFPSQWYLDEEQIPVSQLLMSDFLKDEDFKMQDEGLEED